MGINPTNVATIKISKPIIPVNSRTNITTKAIVDLINKLYGTFEKCFANIFPIFNTKK